MNASDYPNRPLIGVGVVVFKQDRVILIRRGKPPRAGGWALPGGRQRLGETVREAACREVEEECGLWVDIVALLDVVDSLTHDDDGAVQYHYTLIDFLAEWRDGEARAGGDALEIAWADPTALGPFRLWSETERLVAMAVARRSETAQ